MSAEAPNPTTDLSFTVARTDLPKIPNHHRLPSPPKSALPKVVAQEEMGKLSIVGVGMKSHSSIAAKLFEVLAEQDINIDMISTSEIKLSVVISLAQGEQALRAAHKALLG